MKKLLKGRIYYFEFTQNNWEAIYINSKQLHYQFLMTHLYTVESFISQCMSEEVCVACSSGSTNKKG